MTDPFRVPEARQPSPLPLVKAVRAEVDAWRQASYPGASATTRRLLEHWFLDEHRTGGDEPFTYFFAQREATGTIVYLHEVARVRTTGALLQRFADRPVAADGAAFARYVTKMATGSGKTKVMSLAIAWAYFHALREEGSTLSPTSLVIAPNLIVFERLREDFEDARIFRTDPVLPPEWRADFDVQVALRDAPLPATSAGLLCLTNVHVLYERVPRSERNPVAALLGPAPPSSLHAPDPLLLRVAARGGSWWSTTRPTTCRTRCGPTPVSRWWRWAPSSGSTSSPVTSRSPATTPRCATVNGSARRSRAGARTPSGWLRPDTTPCSS